MFPPGKHLNPSPRRHAGCFPGGNTYGATPLPLAFSAARASATIATISFSLAPDPAWIRTVAPLRLDDSTETASRPCAESAPEQQFASRLDILGGCQKPRGDLGRRDRGIAALAPLFLFGREGVRLRLHLLQSLGIVSGKGRPAAGARP